MKTRTLIWAWPTRAFHWMLAFGFAFAYLLSDFDNFRQFHFAFGAMVGALAITRIFYGLIGPRYSRFSHFPVGLKNQIAFAKSVFSKQTAYIGHNPLASLVMLGIMVAGVLTATSGYLLYLNESQGEMLFVGGYFVEEAHEIFANVFLGLVIFHLAGILLDLLLHGKSGAFFSIFNGFKSVDAIPAKTDLLHKIFGVLWICLAVGFFYIAFSLSPLVEKAEGNENNGMYELHETDYE
jgi:cytochrome b